MVAAEGVLEISRPIGISSNYFIGRPDELVHRLSCQSMMQYMVPAADAEEAHAHAA